MEELDDDIIQLGIDAQQQSLSLVHKAISATTTHEKDKIIEEMRHTWRLQENCAQQLNHCNSSMIQLLSRLEVKEKNSLNLYQTLETNTSFLSFYETHPPSIEVKDKMIRDIQNIEDDIQKIGPVSSPNLLSQVSSLQKDFGLLKMRDLTFKRLEELAYTLKKRSFVVDDSEDLSLTVASEYGDLHGLLLKYDELMKENIQLKKEEIAFLNDKIVKRRNLSKLSPSTLTNLAIELQNMLQTQKSLGEAFLIKSSSILNEDGIQRKSFDEACHVSSDIKFTRPEFSTTIQQDTVKIIVEAEDPELQLEVLTDIVQQQRQTIDKLISELEPLRAKNYREIVQTTSQREERFWELQDKFQRQINEIQERIDKTTKECFDLHKNILMVTNQHSFYGQVLGEWMHLYKDLIADETFLETLESSNIQICNSLSSSSFAFGLNGMFKESESNQNFSEYLKDAIKSKQSQQPNETPGQFKIQPPPPLEVSENRRSLENFDQISTSSSQNFLQTIAQDHDPSNNPLMKMHRTSKTRGKGLAPRRKKSVIPQHGLPLLPSENQSVNGDDAKNKKPKNPIEKASKDQLLNYLALTYDILSKISDNPTSFHVDISGKQHYALSTLRNTFFEETKFFEADMRSTLSTLSVASDIILRKPKADEEVFADTQPITETEVQTEEEQKGKGKGKSKPPPKKKK